MTNYRSFRHHPGKSLYFVVLSLIILMNTGCGGGGGSAANVAASVSSDTTVNTAVSGLPVMVDQQGVIMNAVKATPDALYACYIQSGSSYLMFARSDDNGGTWHYSTIDFGGTYASLAVDGTNVYVSYVDQYWKTLKFASSSNRGATWVVKEVDASIKSDPATRPSNHDPGQPYIPADFRYTALARNGGSFFIAYYDMVHSTLRLARSNDGGATWSCTTMDGSDDNDGDSPAIAIDGTNVYISYVGVTGQGQSARDSVFIQVSRNSGASWEKRTVAATAYASGYFTSVAAKDNRVYVSYFNALDRKMMLASSVDNGTAWDIKTVDSSDNVGRYSSLLLGEGVVYLTYSDWNNNSLKVAKSSDEGNSWATRTLAFNTNSLCPAAASVLGNGLYVLYFSNNTQQPDATGAWLTKIVG